METLSNKRKNKKKSESPALRIGAVSSRYRLFPIIVGYRCEGYELQKQHKFLLWKYWKPVKGQYSDNIRCLGSDKDKLVQIAKDLEQLAKHLSTIEVLSFNGC